MLYLFIGKMQSWHDAQDQQRNGELEASVFRAKKNGGGQSRDFLKDYNGHWVH